MPGTKNIYTSRLDASVSTLSRSTERRVCVRVSTLGWKTWNQLPTTLGGHFSWALCPNGLSGTCRCTPSLDFAARKLEGKRKIGARARKPVIFQTVPEFHDSETHFSSLVLTPKFVGENSSQRRSSTSTVESCSREKCVALRVAKRVG